MDWLLGEDNPSVRYFTLIDLLKKPLDDPLVLDTKKNIMTSGIVPKIFARQKEALDLLIFKQSPEGKWILESSWNGRMQGTIEQKDKPGKWITLHALMVLKHIGLDI